MWRGSFERTPANDGVAATGFDFAPTCRSETEFWQRNCLDPSAFPEYNLGTRKYSSIWLRWVSTRRIATVRLRELQSALPSFGSAAIGIDCVFGARICSPDCILASAWCRQWAIRRFAAEAAASSDCEFASAPILVPCLRHLCIDNDCESAPFFLCQLELFSNFHWSHGIIDRKKTVGVA